MVRLIKLKYAININLTTLDHGHFLQCVFKRDLCGHAALTNFKRESHSVMLTELGKFPVSLYLEEQDQSLCIFINQIMTP